MNLCKSISFYFFAFILLFSFPLYSEDKVVDKEKGKSSVGEQSKSDKNVRSSGSMPTLIVFNITPERGVDAGVANLLTDYILTEISNLNKYTVIGQNDIDKMLLWETNKQLKNCTDSSCMAQIAGAMGAEYYVIGSIGVMGDNYIINLKLIDVMKAEVKKRITEVVKKDENAILSSTRVVIGKMFGVVVVGGKVEGKTGGELGKRLEEAKAKEGDRDVRGKKWGWVGYGMMGLGVMIVGVGGYFTKGAVDAKDKWESAESVEEGSKYKQELEEKNRDAVISYISGGAIIVGGILVKIFGDESEGGGKKGEEKKVGRIRIDGGVGYVQVGIDY